MFDIHVILEKTEVGQNNTEIEASEILLSIEMIKHQKVRSSLAPIVTL